MTLEEERAQFLARMQTGGTLIRREDVQERAPEPEPVEKTYAPRSPRFYRSERPGVVAKKATPDAKLSASEQFDALWTPPEEVAARKMTAGLHALAEHYNGK
jgi:hypothetical protein